MTENIKELCAAHGLTLADVSRRYKIPYRSLQHWTSGDREPPEYIPILLQIAIENEYEKK